MKAGDMVRFAKWDEIDLRDSKNWSRAIKSHVGVLINHDKLMSTCEILYAGEILKVRATFVEKAGRRDYESK